MTSLYEQRVLVIGGAGYVGSHLCEELVADNYVVSLDNYLSGSEDNHVDGVEYFVGSAGEINDVITDRVFDYVFHLGEYSRVEQSMTDFTLVMRNNLVPMAEVLRFVNDVGAKLIYSASSTKFTDKEKLLSPYTFTKCTNTELIAAYDAWYGLDYSLAYFFNVYGGREIKCGKFSTVVARFIEQKKSGDLPVKITSPGTQKRNFTHISDTVQGLILIAIAGERQSYCISAREKFSIIELAQMLSVPFEITPGSVANRLDSGGSVETLLKLGWEQKHVLSDYLEEVRREYE